jgi:hypothetical protein
VQQYDRAPAPGDLVLDADSVDVHPAHGPSLSRLSCHCEQYRLYHQYSGIRGSGWPQPQRSPDWARSVSRAHDEQRVRTGLRW